MRYLSTYLIASLLTAIPSLLGADDALEGLLSPLEPVDLSPVASENDIEESQSVETTRTPEFGSMSEADLVALIESSLVDKLGLPGRLELTSIGRLPRIPMDGRPVHIALLENPQRLSGSGVVLRYEILRSGEPVGSWQTVFRCRHLAEVWVPSRRIDSGEALQSTDFEAREIDLVRNPKAVVADPEQFNRYELARAVYPGRPITWSDLAPRALVRKGELVDVIVREGYLSISMKAMATRAGALGDIVAVRNLESKREFPAEVIDEKTVQVFF